MWLQGHMRDKENNSNKANQMIIIIKKEVKTNMTGPP